MSHPNNTTTTYSIPLSSFYNLRNNHNVTPRVIDPDLNPSSLFLSHLHSASTNHELLLDIFRTSSRTINLANQQDRETLIAAVCYIKSTQNTACLRLLAEGLLDKPEPKTRRENADYLFDLCCSEGIRSQLPDLALDLVEYTAWCEDVVVVNALLRACVKYEHFYYMAKVFQDFCTRRDFETYRVVVQGLCKAGDPESAVNVMNQMREEGFVPDQAMDETVAEAFNRDGGVKKVVE